MVSHARSERVARLSDVLFVASRNGAGDDVDHVLRFAAQTDSPSSAYRVGSAGARTAHGAAGGHGSARCTSHIVRVHTPSSVV